MIFIFFKKLELCFFNFYLVSAQNSSPVPEWSLVLPDFTGALKIVACQDGLFIVTSKMLKKISDNGLVLASISLGTMRVVSVDSTIGENLILSDEQNSLKLMNKNFNYGRLIKKRKVLEK